MPNNTELDLQGLAVISVILVVAGLVFWGSILGGLSFGGSQIQRKGDYCHNQCYVT